MLLRAWLPKHQPSVIRDSVSITNDAGVYKAHIPAIAAAQKSMELISGKLIANVFSIEGSQLFLYLTIISCLSINSDG